MVRLVNQVDQNQNKNLLSSLFVYFLPLIEAQLFIIFDYSILCMIVCAQQQGLRFLFFFFFLF